MAKQNKAQVMRFYATIADIQNAITFKGNGDGGRVVFEVPRSEAGALLLLQQFAAAKLIHLTVVVCEGDLAKQGDDLDQAIDELDTELDEALDDG